MKTSLAYKTIAILFCFFCIVLSNNSHAETTFELEFIDLPKHRSFDSTCVYSDVLSYSKNKPFGDAHGRYTNVHETAHAIHSELRNEYTKTLKKRVNAFYCLNGKAVLLEDPNLKIRHVQRYIPDVLRSARYKLYLVDQLKYWDDTPTYLLDEWNCYILGAECAVDDFKRQRDLEKTNAVSGALEFSIYAVALCLAIQEVDIDFWQNNTQFKAFIRHNLHRAKKVFDEGSKVPHFRFKEQDRLYEALLNHPDSASIRESLKQDFGGIFLR